MSGKMVFTGGGWAASAADVGAADGDGAAAASYPVIDAHYHVFPRLGSQREGIDPALRVRFWQYHSREWNQFWRKDDGALVTDRLLEFGSNDIEDMPDVGFRLADHGQAEVTVDGVDYVLQIYPPNLTGNEASPERMLGEMNIAGVDIGVLQSDHVYGELHGYFAEVMARHPGRFLGLAQIWEPAADRPAQLDRLAAAVRTHGMRGVYFSVEPLSVSRLDDPITGERFDRMWQLVEELQVPVFWFLDDRTLDRIGAFRRRVAELAEFAERHPSVVSVITHGLVPAAIIHEIGIPDEVVALLRRDNVLGELLIPAKWPPSAYPYPEGQAQLRELRDAVGAEKLLWGSDSPYGMSAWCTYRQAIDLIRLHCDFLSADEKGLILGGNAARLFGLDLGRAALP